jgi:hypothetical protein
VDHIIPFSISRDDSEENLQVLCANCHAIKSFDENYRISKYKKIRECYTIYDKNIDICWFCLKKYNKKTELHSCEKIMINMDDYLKKYNEDDLIDMNKRKRNESDFVTICNKLKNINIKEEEDDDSTCCYGEVLKVFIKKDYIKCNNKIFKYDAFNVTVETIGHVILKSVDNQRDINRYGEIFIKIDMELDPEEYDFDIGIEKSTDHLIEYLPDFIPQEIIKDGMIIINIE